MLRSNRLLYLGLLVWTATSILFVPVLQASASNKSNYVMLRGGLITFTGNLRKADLDTGFHGEAALGRYLSPNVALEAGIGYFHDGVNMHYGNNIWVIPLMLSLKGVFRTGDMELYAGGGPGMYAAKFHGMVNGEVGEKWATVFGGHLLAGASLDISSDFFLGLEGKAHFTRAADFQTVRSRLNSKSISAHLGFRF